MEKVTFFESIIKIFKMIFSVPFFIEIFILTIVIIGVLSFFSIKKSKKGKITTLIIYVVSLVLLPLSHFSFFVKTIDTIIENYIEILYFPSCYMYFAILLISDIDVLRIIIKNNKESKKYFSLIVNIVYFGIIQFLFFISIKIIIQNNINIFERAELYSNSTLVSFIQMCSYLFWIRIGIILLKRIVDVLSKYKFKKIKIDSEMFKSNLKTENNDEIKYMEYNKRFEQKQDSVDKKDEDSYNAKDNLINITPENFSNKNDTKENNHEIVSNIEINESYNNPINAMQPIILNTKSDKYNNKEETNKDITTIKNNDESDIFFDDFYD